MRTPALAAIARSLVGCLIIKVLSEPQVVLANPSGLTVQAGVA